MVEGLGQLDRVDAAGLVVVEQHEGVPEGGDLLSFEELAEVAELVHF